MAVHPFPLWRPVEPGAQLPHESSLPDFLEEWSPIFEALARRGIGLADVEEWELWQVSRVLGLDRADDRPRTEAEQRADDAANNRRRVLAALGDAPPPEHEPAGPVLEAAIADDMLAKLRAARAERRAKG